MRASVAAVGATVGARGKAADLMQQRRCVPTEETARNNDDASAWTTFDLIDDTFGSLAHLTVLTLAPTSLEWPVQTTACAPWLDVHGRHSRCSAACIWGISNAARPVPAAFAEERAETASGVYTSSGSSPPIVEDRSETPPNFTVSPLNHASPPYSARVCTSRMPRSQCSARVQVAEL